MLSPKQYRRLRDTNLAMEKDGVAKALARKELVVPVTYDFATAGGGTQEVVTITCVADSSDSLDGKYLTLYDEAGSVGVWIDTDNSGTTEPAGSQALDRSLEVTGITTDDTAADVASAVATIIDGDSKFSASADGAVITVTLLDPESVSDAVDVNTGFTVAVDTQGVTAVNLNYTFEEAAIVTKVMSEELTNVTSGGSATVKVRAGTTDLVGATAIASFTGIVNHTLNGSAAGIAVAKGDRINLDVEVDDLTAGKVRFYVYAIPKRDI